MLQKSTAVKFILSLFILFSTYAVNAQKTCDANGVRTEITIKASPQTIWNILIDVNKYPSWNPYIYEVKGEMKQGKMAKFRMKGSPKDRKFSAQILEYRKDSAWAWGGNILFFFKARHYLILEAIDSENTKLIQGESWTGWFGKSFGKTVYKDACENFEKMNLKLKEVAENK